MKRKLNWPIIACLLLWVAVLVLLLSSCSRSVYVPVETVRVDTFVKTAVRVDSVRLTDSVYVSERTVGDTVSGELFGNVGSGTFILGPDI